MLDLLRLQELVRVFNWNLKEFALKGGIVNIEVVERSALIPTDPPASLFRTYDAIVIRVVVPEE